MPLDIRVNNKKSKHIIINTKKIIIFKLLNNILYTDYKYNIHVVIIN